MNSSHDSTTEKQHMNRALDELGKKSGVFKVNRIYDDIRGADEVVPRYIARIDLGNQR